MAAERGPYAKGVAKREEILAVALELIAENGCHSTSNREIAERVGLTQSGLMHYFDSREELYLAVLQARDDQSSEQYWQHSPNFNGFLKIIEHNATVPGLVRLYVEYSAEASLGKHPANGFFKNRYRWLRDRIAEAVVRGQQDGDLGPELNPHQTAELIIAAADGLQLQWLLDPSIDMVQRLRQLWTQLGTTGERADSGPDHLPS